MLFFVLGLLLGVFLEAKSITFLSFFEVKMLIDELQKRYQAAVEKTETMKQFTEGKGVSANVIENFHYKDWNIPSVTLEEWGYLLNTCKELKEELARLDKLIEENEELKEAIKNIAILVREEIRESQHVYNSTPGTIIKELKRELDRLVEYGFVDEYAKAKANE